MSVPLRLRFLKFLHDADWVHSRIVGNDRDLIPVRLV